MTYYTGFAQQDINPEVGIPLVGYNRSGLPLGCCNDGIIDSLFVKVLVINDGEKQCLIIAYDLLGLDFSIVNKIKRSICEKDTSLQPADILVAATHTHSAPATMNFIPQDWIRNDSYNEYLIKQTLIAFDEAIRSKSQAKILSGITSCNWNKYRHIGREVNADHDVAVIRIDTEKKTIVLFTYACHPVILLTSKVSSDYVGYARKTIEEAKISGKETYSIFLNGCTGNVNPFFPNTDTDLSVKDVEIAVMMGNALGQIVNDVLTKTAKLEEAPILTRLEHIRVLNKTINSVRTSHPVEIQLLEFASLRLVTIPGEPFVETGFWIKQMFGKNTIPIGYANENVGYIPTPEYFADPRNDGYEVSGAGLTVYGIIIPQDLEPAIRKTIELLISATLQKE